MTRTADRKLSLAVVVLLALFAAGVRVTSAFADEQANHEEAVSKLTNVGQADAQDQPDAAMDSLEQILDYFPKLKHYMFLHEESLPQSLRDRIAKFAGNLKYIIILPRTNLFQSVGLINRAGQSAVLEFGQGSSQILVKPGDEVVIEVTLKQELSGAKATSKWRYTSNGKPQTVRLNAGSGPPFEPGPAVASAVASHVDRNGSVLDTWGWSTDVELEPF